MQLLPDLTPWVSEERGYLYDWTIQGEELRLTTAAVNIGDGALELRGGDVFGDVQTVNQRIYEADGSFTDVLAGEFVYHEEHAHIHFEDFAEFRLREVLPDGSVGDIVATGDKVSFCLLDVDRYDGSGPASPHYLSCGQTQGISVGWADVYDKGLPGQSIDITGVPDGAYWLEMVVDPENNLIEEDETNNVARIQIDLQRPVVDPPIAPDTFEQNDSFQTASILAPPEDHVYSDLTIHTATDDDYYQVIASETGSLSVSLAFDHSAGDIDLQVFDASQALLGTSESVADGEQVSVDAVAGEAFFVRAYGYNGATNTGYTMTVDQPEAALPGDNYEPNDSFAAATVIASTDDVTLQDLSIHQANNDDYYQVVAAETGSLSISLAFDHSVGDLDLQVFDASEALLDTSQSVADSEQVSVNATAGESYYIRAYGYNGAVNPNYTMTVDQPEAGLPGDDYEPNDSFATAAVIASTDEVTLQDLSIHQANNDDYYQVVAAETGSLSVSLAFDHGAGDLDLQVFDASQALLGTSESVADSEQLSIGATAGESYYIRAYGYNGAVNPNYSMTVDQPEAGAPGDDYEPNDSFAAATVIASTDDVTLQDLSIHQANNDDYYQVVAADTGPLSVSIAFDHSAGDLDLQVFDSSQALLGTSESVTNSEQLSIDAAAGEGYYIRAYGYNGAVNPDYTLTVDQGDDGLLFVA